MHSTPCPGPLRRREFLQAGLLAMGGLGLSDLVAARAKAGQLPSDTSVILLYLHGGPSQLETYDLKPAAPVEYRSVFDPIRTNVPGLDLCELFPLQAQLADKFSLVPLGPSYDEQSFRRYTTTQSPKSTGFCPHCQN